jgi:hypothetical protein
MCRSCSEPFNGKYLQQCEKCGHPAHEDGCCGVGVVRSVPMTTNQHPWWSYLQIRFEKHVGCECPNGELYN